MCAPVASVIVKFFADHLVDLVFLFLGMLISACISVKIEVSYGKSK